jgi:hypothetical protein
MQDVNVSDDLCQLSLGQVKALEYGRYDINGYCFRTMKLEASHPLAATTNSGVLANSEDASGLAYDYYGVLKNPFVHVRWHQRAESCIFQCDWFDLVNGTRVVDFGMVEVQHESRYSCNNLLFAYQAQHVYYMSYPHESMKNRWVVYKVNPEMHTHRYDEYLKTHEDDDVIHFYQEEIEGHQSFMVSNGAGLTKLARRDIELMKEESCLSKKRLQKSKCIIERQERRE